ncbi:MAG: type IV pilin [Salinigranum sp.]
MTERWASGGPDRGTSPVVGVILLIGVVLLLAAVSGAMFLSMTGSLADPAPLVVQHGRATFTVENGSVSDPRLVIDHRGGDAVPVEDLTVELTTDSGTRRVPVPKTGGLADGTWSAGEKLRLGLNASRVCTGADRIGVKLLYSAGDSSYVLGEETIPVRKGGFVVRNGSVVPATDYAANVTLLGTGFTYGAYGPNIDVALSFRVGNDTRRPWPGNVNDGGNPRSHTFTGRRAGTPISATAIGDPDGEYVGRRARHSNGSDGWVYVLRDGDAPPNLAGFGDQHSASSYVRPYLDGNGSIDIADNQAIYLFELGDSKTGPAADYQDAVVLLTLETHARTVGVTSTPGGGDALVCPA